MKTLLRKVLLTAALCGIVPLSGSDKAGEKVSDSLLNQARAGNAQAQLAAGFAFFKQGNPVRAVYWFHAAAAQGLAEAEYNLGRCYLDGYGVNKNHHSAMEYLKKSADKGIQPAKLLLAKLYLAGIAADPDRKPPLPAVPPDEKKGLKLLEELSAAGSSQAYLMHAGHLIKKSDPAQHNLIVKLLQKAVKLGDVDACSMLADYLMNCPVDKRDEKAARKLYEKASGKSAAAMAKLAYMTEHGFGAPPDLDRAFELYKNSIQKDFTVLAAVRLANYYMTGRGIAPLDIPQAVKLYTLAAGEGNSEAICHLGKCYFDGIGVVQDKDQAFELFFQAAQADFAPAQFALAECFAQGVGTPQDQQAAFHWYRQSALRDDPRGMLETGRRYLNAVGTERNVKQAITFLEQAAANGMKPALELLEEARKLPQTPELPQARPTPSFKFKLEPQSGKNGL